MPYKASLNLVIILNGVGLPARILPGFIADRYTGPLNMFAILVLTGIVILWSWLAVRSIAGFYVWTVVYGTSVASFQSMYSTTVAAYVDDLGKIGSRYGMAFTGMGLATLVAGPVSGAFLKVGGGYVAPICWNGGLMVLGTAAVISARIYRHGWSLKTVC
jgi:MFS family permease